MWGTPESYDLDKLGLSKFTKQPHPLTNLGVDIYQQAVDWVKTELLRHGYAPVEARLHPALEAWHFYDERGELIYSCPHEIVERVWEVLRPREDGA